MKHATSCSVPAKKKKTFGLCNPIYLDRTASGQCLLRYIVRKRAIIAQIELGTAHLVVLPTFKVTARLRSTGLDPINSLCVLVLWKISCKSQWVGVSMHAHVSSHGRTIDTLQPHIVGQHVVIVPHMLLEKKREKKSKQAIFCTAS